MLRCLLLATLTLPAFGMPATTTLTLVNETGFNRLTITVDPGFGLSSSQVSTLTGTVIADLEVDPAAGQASQLTLRDGRVNASDVRFKKSAFLLGGYDISGTGLSGRAFTPNPPGSVNPATGTFDASQFGFLLDQGTLKGEATILGSTTPVDETIDAANPVSGQGSGTGTLLLRSPRDSGPYRVFDLVLTLPVSVQDSFDANGTSVALTATGTIKATGTLEVPRSDYLAWTIREGIPGADPAADANGDGLPNAFAWAYRLGRDDDASAFRPRALPGGGYQIPLPAGGTLAPVRILASSDLSGWPELSAARLSLAANPLPAGSSGTVTVATAGLEREFLILEVDAD